MPFQGREKEIVDKLCTASTASDSPGLLRTLHELLAGACSDGDDLKAVISVLNDKRVKELEIDVQVADALFMVDLEMGEAKRGEVTQVVRQFVRQQVVDAAILRERLEPSLLSKSGLVGGDVEKMIVRKRTKMLYKQQKFNLFHEEMEGYAKLLTELNSAHNISKRGADYVAYAIKNLIGFFDLDPNRVLSCIIDAACEARDDFARSQLLDIIPSYTCGAGAVANLVGFRFKACQDLGADPQHLKNVSRVAAELLQRGIITLGAILPFFSHSTDETAKAERNALVRVVRELGKTFLDPAAADAAKAKRDEDIQFLHKRRVSDPHLALALQLLQYSSFDSANKLLHMLPQLYAASHEPVRNALLAHFHLAIEPVYRPVAHKVATPNRRLAQLAAAYPHAKACRQLKDVPTMVFPIVRQLGPYIAKDLVAYTKLVHVLMALVKSDAERLQDQLIEDIVVKVLLPGLTLIKDNPAVGVNLWHLLSLWPNTDRFRMYHAWKNDGFKSCIETALARADAQAFAKHSLKRISKENVRKFGRILCKQSHSNPAVLFEMVLSHLEMFDNLTSPFVDGARYLTPLSKDILVFTTLEALSTPDRPRLKPDKVNVSDWLRNIATFAGSFARKYAVDVDPLLQYVLNQLKDNQVMDLVVLKELIVGMSGLQQVEDLSEQQLSAMAGGPTLRSGDRLLGRDARDRRKAAARLRDALVSKKLGLPLLILMAQQRPRLSMQEEDMAARTALQLFDQCQEMLTHSVEFLVESMTEAEYTEIMPTVQELCLKYKLDPEPAFLLSRPVFAKAIKDVISKMAKEEAETLNGSKSSEESADDKEKTKEKKQDGGVSERTAMAVQDEVASMAEEVSVIHDKKLWSTITPLLYTRFWTLSLYDISVPTDMYDKAIEKARARKAEVEADAKLGGARRRKELGHCDDLVSKLRNEQQEQVVVHKRTLTLLQAECNNWIPSDMPAADFMTTLLQNCVYPRCLSSAAEAVFCARFAHQMHKLKAANWHSVAYYDRLFRDMPYLIASCTANEARNYGIFLSQTLAVLIRWHGSRSIFADECEDYPGFQQAKGTSIGYESYRDVCWKWQLIIAKNIRYSIKSEQANTIRNALNVCNKLLPHFPRVDAIFTVMKKEAEELVKRAEGDANLHGIKTLAQSYMAQLESKGEFVPEHAFHRVAKSAAKPASNSGSGSSAAPPPLKRPASSASVLPEAKQQKRPASSASVLPEAKQQKLESSPRVAEGGRSGSRREQRERSEAGVSNIGRGSQSQLSNSRAHKSDHDQRSAAPPRAEGPSRPPAPSARQQAPASGGDRRPVSGPARPAAPIRQQGATDPQRGGRVADDPERGRLAPPQRKRHHSPSGQRVDKRRRNDSDAGQEAQGPPPPQDDRAHPLRGRLQPRADQPPPRQGLPPRGHRGR